MLTRRGFAKALISCLPEYQTILSIDPNHLRSESLTIQTTLKVALEGSDAELESAQLCMSEMWAFSVNDLHVGEMALVSKRLAAFTCAVYYHMKATSQYASDEDRKHLAIYTMRALARSDINVDGLPAVFAEVLSITKGQ